MDKEGLLSEKNKLTVQCLNIEKRVLVLNKEILRVSQHAGVMIDTDVWVPGVTQRCRTADLAGHLERELQSSKAKISAVNTKVDASRQEILNITEKMAKLKRDADKLRGVTKLYSKALRVFQSTASQSLVKNLSDLQDQAVETENRRARERDVERAVGKRHAKMGGGDDSTKRLDVVRMKESDLRTKEERQFVAIDLVLYPEEYLHLSIVEAEQMQFDSDYLCPLAKPEIERIMKLPEQVNLALPFLSTEDEINVHMLVNKYYRGVDDNSCREKDFYGPSHRANGAGNQSISQSTLPSQWAGLLNSSDLQEAEVVHDILVRESVRDALRALADDEPATTDELMWIQLDKILSPHAYDKVELKVRPTPLPSSSQVTSLSEKLNNSVIASKQLPTRRLKGTKPLPSTDKKGKTVLESGSGRDGDVYEELRQLYAGGEELFHDSTWYCPFSREELLALSGKSIEEMKDPNEQLCFKLMKKYHVTDDESILGHARLREISELSRRVAAIVKDCDAHATERLEAISGLRQQQGQPSLESSMEALSTKAATPPAALPHLSRVWGSWDKVHPASAGVTSQSSFFYASSYKSSRDHPAAFAARNMDEDGDEDSAVSDLSDEESLGMLSMDVRKTKHAKGPVGSEAEYGVKVLTGSVPATRAARPVADGVDAESPYFIAETLSDLTKLKPSKVRGKIFLIQGKEPEILLQEKDATLQARQSRSHYFATPTGTNSKFIVDMTVSIVFQGDFGTKGYKLGRLAAGLFLLPDETRSSSNGAVVPIPVGFSPYAMQSANLPGSLGRIVIIHKPREKPIRPGNKYQVVVGVAASTRYSIEVRCNCAVDALPVLDLAIEEAKRLQSRLPVCLVEMEGVQESIQLTERKLLLCNAMIQDAEAESDRCEKGINNITKQLEQDDEDMQLLEDERRQLKRELSILEIEYAQWASHFATRRKEKADIKEGLVHMYKFQNERLKEKDEIRQQLEKLRGELPSCMAILRNLSEAVQTAAVLNTSLQGVADEIGAAATGDFGGGLKLSTPAEDVRMRFRTTGFNSLLLEEQQWSMLDQALHPTKYEWLREAEEKEKAEREALGKKAKERRFNAAVEEYRFAYLYILRVRERECLNGLLLSLSFAL